MIQIYGGKPIEVLYDGNEAYFKVVDVFKSLGLTWKNTKDSLNERGISNSQLRRGKTLTPLPDGGVQYFGNQPVYISEMALYQLAFRSDKPEARSFTYWAASVIKELRKTGSYSLLNPIVLSKHSDTEYQRLNSKKVNSKNFIEGGVGQTVDYNRKNCELHTGMTPTELKEFGKKKGLKSAQRASGKEVVRNLKPELAASMSLTDSLVNENNLDHEKAAKISRELATPLFKALMDAGVSKEQIGA